MKVLPWLAGISIAANVGFVISWCLQPPASPASSLSATVAQAKTPQGNFDQLRSALESGDTEALKEAGVSSETIHALILGRHNIEYHRQWHALELQPDPKAPYWNNFDHQLRLAEWVRKNQRQWNEMSHENRAVYATVYGDDYFLDSRLSFLPKATGIKLNQIQNDYSELMGNIRANSLGSIMPSDQKELDLLQAEQERDIRALLGPELYEAYELRMSPTANKVKMFYGNMIDSEEEYRQIYSLQKQYDDQYGKRPPNPSTEWIDACSKAQSELNTQIASIIGPDRLAEQKKHRFEHEAIAVLVARYDLPTTTDATITTMRDRYTTQASTIAADTTLTTDQQKAQIQALATAAEAEIQKTLGEDGTQFYTARASWLRQLKAGKK